MQSKRKIILSTNNIREAVAEIFDFSKSVEMLSSPNYFRANHCLFFHKVDHEVVNSNHNSRHIFIPNNF